MSNAEYTKLTNVTIDKSGEWLRKAWAIASGKYNGVTPKSSGKFGSKILLVNEIIRLIKLKAPLPTCDACKKEVEVDDMARSKCGTICIHMDCDDAWHNTNGKPFPYECEENDDEESDDEESDDEPEPVKPHVKLWNAPWDIKVWRLAQGDQWHSDNHCWEFNKKELFNFNTTPYIGKYNEAEQECDDAPRPRNPEWKFIKSA